MSREKYVAPAFKVEPKQVYEIPFNGSVATGGDGGLSSGMITFPFRITKIKAIFTDDAQNLVRYYFLYGTNNNISTTGLTPDINILSGIMPRGYLIGKAVVFNIPVNIEFPTDRLFLKLHCSNLCPTLYYYSGSITIEEL